ncbi:MAG: DUF3090 domain-containing protein [Actinomycetota bacterium]
MDLGIVDRITADAVGEPGMRTFYLQARAGTDLVTVIIEKEQVELLARSVLELLADIPADTADPDPDDDHELEEPIDPRWRAGRLSIGYDREDDRFLVEIDEFTPEIEDEDDPRSLPIEEPESISLWASREQMLALAQHGDEVIGRGRPRCQFCGNPIDPEGHACPATNGHRTPRT